VFAGEFHEEGGFESAQATEQEKRTEMLIGRGEKKNKERKERVSEIPDKRGGAR